MVKSKVLTRQMAIDEIKNHIGEMCDGALHDFCIDLIEQLSVIGTARKLADIHETSQWYIVDDSDNIKSIKVLKDTKATKILLNKGKV